jgi:hypothetical protein
VELTRSGEAADFVAFFAAGWAIGATDPERFYAHFGARTAPEAPFRQPLAPTHRGPAGLRGLFGPVFAALPDLRGEVIRWGATRDGVMIEVELRSPSAGLAWSSLDVITLRDGLIAGRRAHFDPLPLLARIARRPRLALKLLPPLIRR